MKIVTGTIETNNVALTLKTVSEIAEFCKSSVVIIDAAKVAGLKHISSAVNHAKRSFAEDTAISRTLPMEILVYISGQRQCSEAAKFGLHDGHNTVFTVIDGGDEEKTAELLKADILNEEPVECANVSNLMREFEITKEEVEVVGVGRIEELVIERVAMVDAWK